MSISTKASNTLFSNVTVLILLVTVLSFAGIYYFEKGFCIYFKIPADYISIELTKYSYMIFLFIAVFSVAGIVIDSLIGHLIMFYQFRNKFFRLTFILLFVGAIIFFARNTLKYLAFADIVALLITLFYGIILLKNSNQPDDVYRLLVPKYSINIMLSRNLGAVVGPLLIISSMICISLFCMGYLTANNKRDFFILPDNKTVFLKKYGTTIIMGSLEGEKISSIFVRNEPVRIDTLKTIRLSESY